MILIRNLNQISQQLPPIALTIGNFDGVHQAHQKIIAASTAQRTHDIEMAKAIINEGVQTFKVASGNDFKTNIEIHDLRQQRIAVNLKRFMTEVTSVSAPISTPSGPTKTTRKSWEI